MKEVLAIVLLIILVALGWKRSYQSHLFDRFGEPAAPVVATPRASPQRIPGATTMRAPVPPMVVPTPAADRSWLFSPKRMDTPYNQKATR